MFDSFVNQGGDALTGKRKKDACYRVAHMERLVGTDGLPKVGDRVIISSRGAEVRRNGPQCVGTIVALEEGHDFCVVQWDDGAGPYR